MKAVVLKKTCSADELKICEVPVPKVKHGWILIKVKAFGINRSEIYTRQGLSPSVKLPRIIGIECVGEVADPSDSGLAVGQKVISIMGGLGRDFDGSYAEYTLIPREQVYSIDSDLSWTELAAIPETYYTAWCSLNEALKLKKRETLLIRAGSSALGIATIQIAKAMGACVIATTREEEKDDFLRYCGADIVLKEDDTVQEQMEKEYPDKAHKVLELIGTKTMKSSFAVLREGGTLCMSGILGGEWEFTKFAPMDFIPSGSYLTIYDSKEVHIQALRDMFSYLERHEIKAPIAKIFSLDEIAEAHKLMESNTACGKIVVKVD